MLLDTDPMEIRVTVTKEGLPHFKFINRTGSLDVSIHMNKRVSCLFLSVGFQVFR